MGTNAEVEYRIEPGDGSSTFNIYTDAHTQEGIVVLQKVNLINLNKWLNLFKCYILLNQLRGLDIR